MSRLNYIVTLDEVPYQPALRSKYKIMQAGLNVVHYITFQFWKYTVNSEIFVRVLFFTKTSHMRSFVKIKPWQNGEITLTFIDMGKSCPCLDFYRGKYLF